MAKFGSVMKLQVKFSIIGFISVVLVGSGIVINTIEARKISEALNSANLVAKSVQNHMDGDMMHDAIRGDVLSALYARATGDTNGINRAKADLEEHSANFLEDFKANLNLPLPQNILTTYQESMESLNAYIEAARAIIAGASAGQDTASVESEFVHKFEAMELANEELSNRLQQWNDTDKEAASALIRNDYWLGLLTNLLVMITIIALPILTLLLVFRPLRHLIRAMETLKDGDYSIQVTYTERQDEMGAVARAIEQFRENGLKQRMLEQQQEAVRQVAYKEEERQRARVLATDAFAKRMQEIITKTAQAASGMYETIERMSAIIENSSRCVSNVASASSSASDNVQSVAAATEEMSATVREISQQMQRSATNVKNAVLEVARADTIAAQLDEATRRIGQIVDVIQNIAGQINLLALNATIESARAGEAGKGFSVVAGEVKALASQTSSATGEIASNISSIQNVSTEVLQVLHAIKAAIVDVEQISGAVSSAVEQQGAATREIAANMENAAKATLMINDDVKIAHTAANDSSVAAQTVQQAAGVVLEETRQLNREVTTFLTQLSA